jgi:hypothetical protein
MKLPFTTDQFVEVFKTYNTDLWPLQIVFILLAVTILFFVFRKGKYSGKIISLILSAFWLWMGIVYHIIYFSSINKAAYIFGALFIVQGFSFIYFGLFRKNLISEFGKIAGTYSGILLITFALIFYPVLGYLFGHVYPESPTFGLPCPTTIFTLGILLLLKTKRIILMIIPLSWSMIGFTAAIKLGIYEDTGLLAAGIITIIIFFYERSSTRSAS